MAAETLRIGYNQIRSIVADTSSVGCTPLTGGPITAAASVNAGGMAPLKLETLRRSYRAELLRTV